MLTLLCLPSNHLLGRINHQYRILKYVMFYNNMSSKLSKMVELVAIAEYNIFYLQKLQNDTWAT
jgi:hypothetical protein